jgi:hypothetical protein
MRESSDADENETVRRPLSAFAHTLVDDPRVANGDFRCGRWHFTGR